jgi:hypothetical protein
MANWQGIAFSVLVILCMVFVCAMAANAVCKEPYVLEWEAIERGETDPVPDRVGPRPDDEGLEMSEGSWEDMDLEGGSSGKVGFDGETRGEKMD